jgi:DNA-binding response OmpR family regulator
MAVPLAMVEKFVGTPEWLVVEDDPDTLHLICLYLRMYAGEQEEVPYVVGASSARKAAFTIEENGLVRSSCRYVLDVNLPDKNGFVIRQWLTIADVPKERILMISTDYEEYIKGLVDNGGYKVEEARNLVMKKPVELPQLLERVKSTGIMVRESPRKLSADDLMM